MQLFFLFSDDVNKCSVHQSSIVCKFYHNSVITVACWTTIFQFLRDYYFFYFYVIIKLSFWSFCAKRLKKAHI